MGVPISGAITGHLMGQGTCRSYLSTGTAKSEPHGCLGATARCGTGTRRAADVQVVYPGCRGARVVPGGAHLPGVDECIYGGGYRARAGQGRCQKQCQNQCHNSARTSAITAQPAPDTSDTQHPIPDTRYP